MKTSKSRRLFIKKGALASIAVPVLGINLLNCNPEKKKEVETSKESPKKLSILILGGTSFLGPHQIAYAVSRGHKVSTFTRGKTIPTVHKEVFKNIEQLIGDREDNLKTLENRKWDVVIDNSGRKVQWTKDTANLLKDNVGIYMYTSSTGVYYPYKGSNIKEDTKLVLDMPEGLTEDQEYEQDYGIMKGNSELEAIKAFGKERSIIVRPTYMVGPADRTNRFIHWPIRLAKGGDTVVPGKQEDLVQYVDVRDVAEWYIRLAENKQHGTYNAVGPKDTQTVMQFINEAANTFNVKSSFIYVDDYEFLKENNIYYQIPWVMPEGDHYGSARIAHQKAMNAGLTYRDLKLTVKDTHDWWYSDAVTEERRQQYNNDPNMLISKEKDIISKWKQKLVKD
ncbi:NAD-dependent epimerase/dehydratase family protein [uncultured Psychroserpens sp.]|uniref:NAD-dependent epimerase/dehydratase family protein n=1 Tax=uncultured Psychroserpens sp. TaxID=255436 RepID=UPI00261CDED5|nr:NAD-dependent epimerase/dehydratase family protein [uncultured Psychroserpens sp.]